MLNASTHGAARIRQDRVLPIILLVIHPKHDIRHVLARRRDQHPLSSPMRNVHLGTLSRRHLARTLHDVFSSRARPVEILGIALREEVDQPPAEEQCRWIGIMCGREELIWVIRWCETEIGGVCESKGAMGGVVSDGGHEVFGGEGGVVNRD